MRSDCRFDEATPSFTLICPGYRGASRGSAGKDGKLTFTIGSDVVAEIGHDDLLESWEAAAELSQPEARKMTVVAASHLSEILECGISSGDLAEVVTDAAVVFLLVMKRQGISDPKRIPACTVMWNGHEGREHVFFGA
jgi:hypothetical protein